MELSKIIKEADYAALKDHCASKIASHIATRIQNSQSAFIAKVRGVTESKEWKTKCSHCDGPIKSLSGGGRGCVNHDCPEGLRPIGESKEVKVEEKESVVS
jgi:hypothetical protein